MTSQPPASPDASDGDASPTPGAVSADGTPSPSPSEAARQEKLERLEQLVVECLAGWEDRGPVVLEELCAQHPEQESGLRRRVQVLRDLGILQANTRQAPESLGEFRLLSVLGEGGMGVVYRAVQTSLQREVALKLVRPDQRLFADSRQRFLREVEAVARLQHPGIVPLYTVGEEQGVLYYSMELVAGCTLAQLIEHLRDQGADPRQLDGSDLLAAVRALSPSVDPVQDDDGPRLFGRTWTECCLRIALRVCEALGHAHGRGVLHRDVKASNIMLTPQGRVLLLDFGLASTGGDARITRTGALLGSLAFMSPEQVRGEVDAITERSDVYGVGIVLYELLTLAIPFEEDGAQRLREAILTGRPLPVRSRNASLPLDVEIVCHKAMDVDAGRLYATCTDLARDLENILNLRPIEARPPSQWRRLQRAAQRHPARAVALVAAVLFALGLFPTLYWQKHRSNLRIAAEQELTQRALVAEKSAREDLQAALTRAQAGETKALLGLSAAREAVRKFLTEIGAFKAADVPLLHGLRRDTLEEALRFYDRLVQEFGADDRGLEWERAHILFEIAEVQHSMDLHVEAEATLRQLRSEIDRLWAEDSAVPGIDIEAERMQIDRTLGSVLIGEGKIDEARALLEPLVEPFEARRAAADTELEVAPTTHSLANLYCDLGQCAAWKDEHPEARTYFEHALELSPENSTDLTVLRSRAMAEEGIADACSRSSDGVQARRHYEDAVSLRRRIVAQNPASAADRERLAIVLENAGTVIANWSTVDLRMCLPYFDEGVSVLQSLFRDYPGQPAYLQLMVQVLLRSSEARDRLGLAGQARGDTQRAVDLLEELREKYPEEHSWRLALGFSYHTLARCCLAEGLREDACANLEEGMAVSEELAAQASGPDIANFQQQVAEAKLGLASWDVLDDEDEQSEYAWAAFELGLSFLHEHPENAALRGTAYRCFEHLAERLAEAGDGETLLEVADRYRDANPWKWQSQITLARAYLRAGESLPPERAEDSERCNEDALRALRRASEHSAQQVLRLEGDEEFAELLGTEGGEELMAELRAKIGG